MFTDTDTGLTVTLFASVIQMPMQNTGYRLPDTGYRIQDTGYRIPDTRYNI